MSRARLTTEFRMDASRVVTKAPDRFHCSAASKARIGSCGSVSGQSAAAVLVRPAAGMVAGANRSCHRRERSRHDAPISRHGGVIYARKGKARSEKRLYHTTARFTP